MTAWIGYTSRGGVKGGQKIKRWSWCGLLGSDSILFKEQGTQWTCGGKSQKEGNERVGTIHLKSGQEREREKLSKS